jgi:hypothetical protein
VSEWYQIQLHSRIDIQLLKDCDEENLDEVTNYSIYTISTQNCTRFLSFLRSLYLISIYSILQYSTGHSF